ncbi:dUTP diphosphatase [Edhazardia aedis USNM 41457]|uniref:Deoxyuridine 5'-triphosphate nucleotidohydrolase n=1 Tax=Edhazardia aedis (strain USNM 41457) TaxID=1003232 RepID=J9D6Z7_EDHAE|nr:dUTP diphosphatase [Edhazardia aedis USNM 41457]|eukprot:EJW03304.1 dUTP diphosphatase [Edhazardia aedis USNM 41457]
MIMIIVVNSPSMLAASRLSKNAIIPQRHSKEAAGCDLNCNTSGVIYPKSFGAITTGISVHVPKGYIGIVYGRSGLTNKFWLEVFTNVIHNAENDEIIIKMFNHSNESFTFKAGERVAQIVFVQIAENICFDITDE